MDPTAEGETLPFAIGIDIGGSGIKGACVDLDVGRMLTERKRIPTPRPASPNAVIDVISDIVSQCECDCVGPVGCAFPAVIRNGMLENATNLDESWVGFEAEAALSKRLGQPVCLLNDADAAGIAEMKWGAGASLGQHGSVLLLTFGTGIGSALFVNGTLLRNTELGELQLDGFVAETRASGRLREEGILSWEEWIVRVQRYLDHVELLLSPDRIIFGGGISECWEQFMSRLTTRAEMVPAAQFNNAGIVGAALAASQATGNSA